MRTKAPATIEDLYNVSGKAELIDGEIIQMTPTGYAPHRAALRVTMSLLQYESEYALGRALGDNVGFVVDLPERKSFSPDAAFYIGELPSGLAMDFIQGAPTFAVEVRSSGDYGPAADKKIAAKRVDYFAAGTQVVWDVDLLSDDVVQVYRAENPTQPAIYRRGETADAEPALPGWIMPVDALFR